MAEFRTAVAVGVGWTAAQKWLVRIAGVLTFVVLSRLLGPADIGLVALALAFLGVLGVVADLGAATFLVQTRSWDERTRSTTFWTTLALSLAATGLVVVLASPLAGLLGEPRLAPVFQALAPILVLSVTSAVPSAILQRELRFRELALREMAAGLLSAAVGVALALAGAGVWALVGQSGTQALVSAVLVWRMSAWRPTRQVSREAFAELRRFGGPVLAVNVLQSVRDRLEQFLLGALLGVTALGYWTVAVRLLALLVDVSVAVLDSVALPVFAAARTSADRFRRAFEYALSATQVLLVPALALLAVASPVLLPWLFGAQWDASIPPAQVLCLAYGIAGLGYFNRAALLSHGRSGVELALTAASLTVHLALVVLVAPLGLTALAWAFAGEAVFTVLLGAVTLRGALGIGPATWGRPSLVVGGGLLAVAAALGAMRALSLGPVAGVVTGGAVTVVVLGLGLWLTNAPLLRQLADDVGRLRGRGREVVDGERADEPGGDAGPERVRGDVGAHQ
ncbi:lipopolysaccharide biosynthesis protein [Blastococcus jejuensis]|uniref:Lipopolysaccharide biosynthesis protein n=1 Tax=Blastococcus jejuensis TaxID=351224 RepID=A0ABP6P9A5_9ACTN